MWPSIPRPENDCLEEMATICAMMSAENLYHFPRRLQSHGRDAPVPTDAEEGSHENGRGGGRRGHRTSLRSAEEELERHAVEDAHRRLQRPGGDHFTYLHIYEQWTAAGRDCVHVV